MNMTDLIKVRRDVLSAVRKNREVAKTNTFYTEMLTSVLTGNNQEINNAKTSNQMENIIDIRYIFQFSSIFYFFPNFIFIYRV